MPIGRALTLSGTRDPLLADFMQTAALSLTPANFMTPVRISPYRQ
jgi:hypothetical protein